MADARSLCDWKPNWEETKRHFVDWWARRGLVLGSWRAVRVNDPLVPTPDPGPPRDREQAFGDAAWRLDSQRWAIARSRFPADTLPVVEFDLGPGVLSLFLGARPDFDGRTVWYHPCIHDPERDEPLRFRPENRWWRFAEETAREAVRLGGGRYMVAFPDLIENIDTLAALRGSQDLLVDLIERPAWVERRLWEINEAFFEAFDRLYALTKGPDGGSAFGAFRLWGPGRTAKVQCDASAMFSPDFFRRFVVPPLTAQCERLDYSMFHLDGHQCLPHLDHLLAIEALDAIEWTPDPQVPGGGSPVWYDLYRRILAAGKSVQAIGVKHEEIIPLLDAVGGRGLYIMTEFPSVEVAEELETRVAPYRR